MKTFWRILTIISIALWIGGAVWILMQYDRTYKRVGLHRTEIYKMWNIEIDDYYSQSLADEIIDCCDTPSDVRLISDYLSTKLITPPKQFLKEILQKCLISNSIENAVINHSENWWDNKYKNWTNDLRNGDLLHLIGTTVDTDSETLIKLCDVGNLFKDSSFESKWDERFDICSVIHDTADSLSNVPSRKHWRKSKKNKGHILEAIWGSAK